jgi:hypothetical protein
MIPQERRVHTRKALDHLAYISLPHNNGGVVLDVSEGGLRFHALAPVKGNGPISFQFEIDSGRKFDGVGELAWLDPTGKFGGLRFTQLPNEIREQIRVLTSQPDTAMKAVDAPLAGPPVEVIAAPRSAPDSASVESTAISVSDYRGEAACGGEIDLAPFSYVAAAESALGAERTASLQANWLPAGARINPVLYSLRPPIYSAPSYKLSMFPLHVNRDAAATPISGPGSIILSYSIAAIGLTFTLAILASIGIFTLVSTSWAGVSFIDWVGMMWGGPRS